MDLKRLTEWLSTADGLMKALLFIIAVPGTIWAAATKELEPVIAYFHLPAWAASTTAFAMIIAAALILRGSFRRFSRESRLEQPDAFTLKPSSPSMLIGRSDDLAGLINSVQYYRLVLMDGESGCGKSALVSAGLEPILLQSDGLLPVIIRDWGDDWVRGPFSAALGALVRAVNSSDRKRLDWTVSPDLAAEPSRLADDLDARLEAIFEILGRRLLLIADQFDDYQARHRSRFLDQESNWLSPAVLTSNNRFWEWVSVGLHAGRLHLLVISRADTAAGLACVRFLGEDQSSARTLARVEVDYLHPLLTGIAPEGADPAVVSHPEGGWHALRERIERDLKMEGAILMQQVRTVLLGLRQIPLLTLRHYFAAGGLRGIETLVVSRAINRAGEMASGGEEGRRTVRAMLSALISPGGPNQPPKSQRASFSVLSNIAGDKTQYEAILSALQRDELVRPAEELSGEIAWQLDHDYLARAVLAEARQADRWSVALHEGKSRYEDSVGNWRLRWRALMSFGPLTRVIWERMCGRLSYGNAVSYVWLSAVKTAVAVLFLLLIGVAAYCWNRDRLLTDEANQLVNSFGGGNAEKAVLIVWRAPAPLRERLYQLLSDDHTKLELATLTNWSLAHSGLDPIYVREALASLRARMLNIATGPTSQYPKMDRLFPQYLALLSHLSSAADLKAEATNLHELLVRTEFIRISRQLGYAYEAVVAKIIDAKDLKAEATSLGTSLEQSGASTFNVGLAKAYSSVASRLSSAEDLKTSITRIRTLLAQDTDSYYSFLQPAYLADDYATLIARMSNPSDLKAEATSLRTMLQTKVGNADSGLVIAYAALVAQMDDPSDLKAEATSLRTMLQAKSSLDYEVSTLALAYASVAPRLSDVADLKDSAKTLRTVMATGLWGLADELAGAYEAVIGGLSNPSDLKAEAISLRTLLTHETSGIEQMDTEALGRAYVAVLARMSTPSDLKAEATSLRTLLARKKTGFDNFGLAIAYAAVAARLGDTAFLTDSATILHRLMVEERNAEKKDLLGYAYENVISRISDLEFLENEVLLLWGLVMDSLSKTAGEGQIDGLEKAWTAAVVRMNKVSGQQFEPNLFLNLLGGFIKQSRNSATLNSLGHAYKEMVAQVKDKLRLKGIATELRLSLEQNETSCRPNENQCSNLLVDVYTAVVTKTRDTEFLKSEAADLRKFLAQSKDFTSTFGVTKAYAAVASQLKDTALRSEASSLRSLLAQAEGNMAATLGLAKAYGVVAVQLRSAVDLGAAAAIQRTMLEQMVDQESADSLAKSYADVAAGLFEHTDGQGHKALTIEILTLAGQPFLMDPTPLLAALKPYSKKDFGGDVGGALLWAEQEFGVRSDELRPSPLPIQ